jgi:hypothetical protein
MHPYETYLWPEIMALLQSVEHALHALQQTFAMYLPVVLATLVVGLVIGLVVVGMHYLRRASGRPAHRNSYLTVHEIVVTEAGDLALLSNLEVPEDAIAGIWNMDQPPPARAACN